VRCSCRAFTGDGVVRHAFGAMARVIVDHTGFACHSCHHIEGQILQWQGTLATNRNDGSLLNCVCSEVLPFSSRSLCW
jgi:hypothetical protein